LNGLKDYEKGMRTWEMMPGGWLSAAQIPETTVEVTNCWQETINDRKIDGGSTGH